MIQFVVVPLFASKTYRGADNWENAIKSCNLTIFNADNSNGEHSSKIWQPFVQIMTYPLITKGKWKRLIAVYIQYTLDRWLN